MKLLLSIILLFVGSQALAEDEWSSTEYLKHAIYIGIGSAERETPKQSGDTPLSLGYIYRAEHSKTFWGVDVGWEGTSFDSTSGKDNEVTRGTSFNLLMGRNFNLNPNWRMGAGFLLGAREAGQDCPDSYLGYECYADEDPDTEYEFNYGALFHLTFKYALIGVRVTGESSQMMLGFSF